MWNTGQLQRWAAKLGIGKESGLDLPGESEGLVPSRSWRNQLYKEGETERPWSAGDNIQLATGQGDLQTNPLQLAIAYAALCNGGTIVTPHVGMYAVIESGGKQYKVEEGTSLLVDRLDAKEGDKVSLRPVLFRDSDVVAAPKELEKVKVEAKVAEHLRGPKIKVFKYKAKKGYRRRAGHRSELTKLEVTSLKMGKAAAKKAADKAPAKDAEKEEA